MDDDNDDIWQLLTETVQPIKSNKLVSQEKQKPIIIDHKVKKQKSFTSSVHEQFNFNFLEVDDTKNMDANKARKLKSGKIQIEARLDLHGYNKEQALDVVLNFINSNYEQGRRLLLIITGKGGAKIGSVSVLKENLPIWLNYPAVRDKILSIVPAQPKDGGKGAFYILLKRIR